MPTHIFSPWPPFPLNRFTNATRDFKGTLDYILFTTDSLVPSASLELPDETEVRTKAIAGEWVGGRRVITFSFHLKRSIEIRAGVSLPVIDWQDSARRKKK